MNNFQSNQSKIFNGCYILVCIDGTGSKDWRLKDEMNSNSNSYVKQFHDNFFLTRGFRKYLDGPTNTLSGSDCYSIASDALNFINRSLSDLERLNKLGSVYEESNTNRHNYSIFSNISSLYKDFNKKIRIVLIGHSRGGAIATYVASKLRFPVYFLGLYDAVNSSTTLPNTDMIKNVQYAYHAKRNLERSRYDLLFNQTALSNVSGMYKEAEFKTSHGGTGGDPFASSLVPGFNDILVHPIALAISDLPSEVAATIQQSVLNLHFTPIFNTGMTENLIRTESRKANGWMIQNAQLHGLTVQ